MPTSTIARVLLIDDLEMNNEITSFFIRKLYPAIEVVEFTNPLDGLAYIKAEYQHGGIPTLMLLDINMPELSGWEVVEILNACDKALTKNLNIYILSSTIDTKDKSKAAEASNVAGFLSRPLTAEMMQVLWGDKGSIVI